MAATKDNPIIFYDIADANGSSFSPNPYKTRLTLNYKGLPYRVEYLTLPDIEPKCKELGLTPRPTFPSYTLPMIADPSSDPNGEPTYVMDSFKIALYLDDKYPAPQYPVVFPPGTRGIQNLFITQYLSAVGGALDPIVLPSVPLCLNARSAEYWYRTRGDRFKPLSEDEIATQWQVVREKWAALGTSLDFNKGTSNDGPFIMGKQISFVDFAVGGEIYFLLKVEGKDSARFKEVLEWRGGRWKAFWGRIVELETTGSTQLN